jgi:hypothetical protein
MFRTLAIAAKVSVIACIVVAECLWSAFLMTRPWMQEPYLTATIIGNTSAAIAASLVVLWLRRENLLRIAKAFAFSTAGAIAGMAIAVWAYAEEWLHGRGDIALLMFFSGAIGAVVGFLVWEGVPKQEGRS